MVVESCNVVVESIQVVTRVKIHDLRFNCPSWSTLRSFSASMECYKETYQCTSLETRRISYHEPQHEFVLAELTEFDYDQNHLQKREWR